jgi:hypothetical protein
MAIAAHRANLERQAAIMATTVDFTDGVMALTREFVRLQKSEAETFICSHTTGSD